MGFLVLPVWVHQTDLTSSTGAEQTPPLLRTASKKKIIAENSMRWSNPRPLKAFHQTNVPYPYGTLFSPLENFSRMDVMRNYHPTCLDNYNYFLGSQTTTILLEGKRVGVCFLLGARWTSSSLWGGGQVFLLGWVMGTVMSLPVVV